MRFIFILLALLLAFPAFSQKPIARKELTSTIKPKTPEGEETFIARQAASYAKKGGSVSIVTTGGVDAYHEGRLIFVIESPRKDSTGFNVRYVTTNLDPVTLKYKWQTVPRDVIKKLLK